MGKETPRYERRDLSVRMIGLFAAALVILGVVAAVSVRFFEHGLDRYFAYRGTATWTDFPAMVAPPPQLQINSASDLAELRAREDRVLHSYAWMDRPSGVVRIPIDVAMQLTAERGLPVRKSTPPPKPVLSPPTP